MPPSIVAQMILSGTISQSGVLPPEVAVDPLPFFKELAKRNIIMRQISEEELVAPGENAGSAKASKTLARSK